MVLDFTTDDGIGTRATMGLVVLQGDETVESEVRQIVPGDGVAVYHTRIAMPPVVNPETLASMKAEMPKAAAMLPDIDFDVVGYCCTSGATVIGPSGVAAAIQTIHPEALVTDPVSAAMAAFRALNINRIGFVTPYVAEVSSAMRALLEGEGFEIAGFGSFEEGDDRVVARISPQSVLQAVETVNAMGDCEAVFVSCTNLRVAGIVAEAESRIGKPVISSNLALIWHMLSLAGVEAIRPGYGRLLSPGSD